MSDTHISDTQLIIDSAQRIFTDLCDYETVQGAEDGRWPTELHSALLESGLLQLGLPQSGTTLADLMEFLRVAAGHAAPLPLLEWGLAQYALGEETTATGLILAEQEQQHHDQQGASAQLVWPQQITHCLVFAAAKGLAALVPTQSLTQVEDRVISGEPCVRLAGFAALDFSLRTPNLYALGALGRCAQMCGALERILEITLGYASDREQFGRSISKFQAIQHQLAVMAAEVAAGRRATDAAIHSCTDEVVVTDIAVAKVRVGQAAGVCAEIAHQVHGAMGFTMEYRLHHFTRRLWAWRDDYGTEDEWAEQIGDAVCALGSDKLWSFVADHG